MKRIPVLLFVLSFAIFTVVGPVFALQTSMDAQKIGDNATVSLDITTSADPHILPLDIEGAKKNENIEDLADIVTSKAEEISALVNAKSISYKTAFVLEMGHSEYPVVSGDFEQKVQFTVHMDNFSKTFSNDILAFVPKGGINALDDYPDETEIVGVDATYDAETNNLIFSLNPASEHLDVDGDTYVVIGDVDYNTSESASSGGCNVGLTAVMLLAVVPAFYRKKKITQ
ncbi:MAG: SYNERG-CTERM sorting domain-containing protein [Acholeplasmataceae bacterium]|nr:SYNERG-CTERM sorting domain-containing protein [Candidatus Cloacimonadota bacterium]MDD2259710.1 SYNERG-CTERM sorting domain-containing protein [Acholeplasmataceae bacterium]